MNQWDDLACQAAEFCVRVSAAAGPGALCDDYADSGLTATRLCGRTHYLAASTGSAATDFVQLEIEELPELSGHVLFAADTPPGSIQRAGGSCLQGPASGRPRQC